MENRDKSQRYIVINNLPYNRIEYKTLTLNYSHVPIRLDLLESRKDESTSSWQQQRFDAAYFIKFLTNGQTPLERGQSIRHAVLVEEKKEKKGKKKKREKEKRVIFFSGKMGREGRR